MLVSREAQRYGLWFVPLAATENHRSGAAMRQAALNQLGHDP